MSDMITRVAKAICVASDQPWGTASDNYRDICIELARAAIEAMREPGDDIAWAMNDVAIDGPGYVSFYPSFADCKTLFNAAITAALSQDTHSLPSTPGAAKPAGFSSPPSSSAGTNSDEVQP